MEHLGGTLRVELYGLTLARWESWFQNCQQDLLRWHLLQNERMRYKKVALPTRAKWEINTL